MRWNIRHEDLFNFNILCLVYSCVTDMFSDYILQFLIDTMYVLSDC